MIRIQGRNFLMGSTRYYAEEAPVREVYVDGFQIDETPVTNSEFAAFVSATGYRTEAETPLDPKNYPELPTGGELAGSLVFRPESACLARPLSWWKFEAGVSWSRPYGPDSSIDELGEHPVVHVTALDAEAYAEWAGKSLPTEAEWELAARGGIEGSDFAWGDELTPGGRMLCNFWQGDFPGENLVLDGFERTSPVHYYPPNGYGLYDMTGNVWEWTADWYAERDASGKRPDAQCCVPKNPHGATREESVEPGVVGPRIPRRVIKGGSHLCAANYCRRYRPAARIGQMVDSSTTHIGFRCVIRD